MHTVNVVVIQLDMCFGYRINPLIQGLLASTLSTVLLDRYQCSMSMPICVSRADRWRPGATHRAAPRQSPRRSRQRQSPVTLSGPGGGCWPLSFATGLAGRAGPAARPHLIPRSRPPCPPDASTLPDAPETPAPPESAHLPPPKPLLRPAPSGGLRAPVQNAAPPPEPPGSTYPVESTGALGRPTGKGRPP